MTRRGKKTLTSGRCCWNRCFWYRKHIQVHNKQWWLLFFPRRSSLCVSGAADGYRVWTTDVEGKECLSNHERVPPMGERRACRSILREANPGSTQIKANLSVTASCKFHFLHCMFYRLYVFCELCSSIFLVFYLLFDVFFFLTKEKYLDLFSYHQNLTGGFPTSLLSENSFSCNNDPGFPLKAAFKKETNNIYFIV